VQVGLQGVQLLVEVLRYYPFGQVGEQVFVEVSKNKLPLHDKHSELDEQVRHD